MRCCLWAGSSSARPSVMGRACMLVALIALAAADEPTGQFWTDFLRRPHFAHRLLHHPITGERLRDAPECDLRGTWTASGSPGAPFRVELTGVGKGSWAVRDAAFGAATGTLDEAGAAATVAFGAATLTGTVGEACSVITWSGDDAAGRVWRKAKDTPVKKVHVVFMNHLDIGYAIHPSGWPGPTPPAVDPTGYMLNVVNEYTSVYFPQAQALSRGLRAAGNDRFIYTTHPWLVSLYIDCPEHYILANGTQLFCPDAKEKADFVEAVQRGDITWHDGPFNLQSEIVGPPVLFEWGLQQSLDINAKLNHTASRDRKVYNLRDVPGTTRAVVPILAKNGYKVVTVGQNGGTPATGNWSTHKMFLWEDKASGTELLYLNHAGGYPNDPGPNATHCGGLCRSDCMMQDGLDEALCFAFRNDNSGPPPSVAQAENIFTILRTEFPGAEVVGSTLDAFAEAALRDTSIYERHSEEIADTWTQGVQSDPKKMAEYRAFARAVEKCAATDATCRPGGSTQDETDWRVLNATRLLLTLPEHTWGLPGYSDTTHWSKVDFNAWRDVQPYFRNLEMGWAEHRTWLDYALEALGDHPLAAMVNAELAELAGAAAPEAETPPTTGRVHTAYTCGLSSIAFDESGAINHLVLKGGADLASADRTLGGLVYSTYTEKDFAEMSAVYTGPTGGGCGFSKPGMDHLGKAERLDVRPAVKKLARHGACTFVIDFDFPADVAAKYGAPTAGSANVTVDDAAGMVTIDMRLVGKSASRLAEAAHVVFAPALPAGTDDWKMHKLGSVIDPYDVMLNGNSKQHGVWGGVTVGNLTIDSKDITVVSPITPDAPATPFLKDMRPLKRGSITGFGFNVFNNIWETNYAFYYPYLDADTKVRARFTVAKRH